MMSWILATAFLCWVSPMHQQTMIRLAPRTISAACRICSLERPESPIIVSHGAFRSWEINASYPSVKSRMKSWSKTLPGRRSSSSSSSFISPWKKAMSPFILTGSQRSESWVPRPKRNRGMRSGWRRSWGFLNRNAPVSGRGFTNTILHPFSFAFCSAVSIRGWLVPGFWPAMMIASAISRSCSFTQPLPMPIIGGSATLVDSWHMLEQSGRLLVP